MLNCSERKRQLTPTGEVEKKDEEEWPLKDVVFIEDVKTVPVGKVLKVSPTDELVTKCDSVKYVHGNFKCYRI